MTAPSGQPLAGRLALVTGASRGIGAAVAKRFASAGAHVVLTARTVGGLEDVDDAVRAAGGLVFVQAGGRAAGGQATLVPFDLRDGDKIDQLAAALYERFGRLDILVGNAGQLGALSPAGHLEPKVWQEVMDVNVTANWRLIRALDPLLRRSEAGRAIFVTCAAGRAVTPYWSAYAASKAALETLVRTYAGEVAATTLRVNLIDPGVVGTKLRLKGFPGESRDSLRPPEAVVEPFVALASAECTRHGELVIVSPLAE
jgi:NAD(P)-dependent dehydrogenase (short-subunit alcohol dehydrogenase family)